MLYDRINEQMNILRRANLLGTQLERLAIAGGIQGMLRGLESIGGLDEVVNRLQRAVGLPTLNTVADAVRHSMPMLDELRRFGKLDPETLESIAGWQGRFLLATDRTLSELDLRLLDGTAFRRVLLAHIQMRPVMDGLLERFSWLTRDLTTQPLDRIVGSLAGIRTIAAQLRSPQLAVGPALEVTQAVCKLLS